MEGADKIGPFKQLGSRGVATLLDQVLRQLKTCSHSICQIVSKDLKPGCGSSIDITERVTALHEFVKSTEKRPVIDEATRNLVSGWIIVVRKGLLRGGNGRPGKRVGIKRTQPGDPSEVGAQKKGSTGHVRGSG